MIRDKDKRISLSKVLLVEGKGPAYLFEEILATMGLNSEIEIVDFLSIPQFRDSLKAFISERTFKKITHLGIIRDCEINNGVKGSFESVCDGLKLSGISAPDKINTPSNGNPKISIYILPDCVSEGKIETLILKAVKEEGVLQCIDNYFICLSEQGIEEPNNLEKAKIQVYLASKPVVNLTLHFAAQKGYIPSNSPVFDGLRKFFTELYG
jgi:hypothetical protein